MKKRIVASILAMTMLLSLAGCSGSSGESGGGSDGDVVEIEFLHGNPEEARIQAIDEIIADFEEENPDIKVTQVPVQDDSFWTKVTTMMSAGELPAVLEAGVDQLRQVNAEGALDLDANEKAIEAIGKDGFYSGALEMAMAPEKAGYLGVPVSGWVSGIWYRKSLFEENGLEPPTTWENILKAAQTLNDPANKNYGIMISSAEVDFTEQSFSSFTGSVGYQLFDDEGQPRFNTPEMKELLEFYNELYKCSMPGSNGVEEVNDAFTGGHAAMAVYSTYIMETLANQGLADDVGFAIPENTEQGSFGMTSNLAISNMVPEEEREAAVKFIAFLGEKEENIKWCHMSPGGSNPVLKDVAEDPEYLDNEVLQAFGDTAAAIPETFENLQMLGVQDGEVNPAMANISSKFIIPHYINQILVQGEDIDTAMQECQAALEAEVEAVK